MGTLFTIQDLGKIRGGFYWVYSHVRLVFLHVPR